MSDQADSTSSGGPDLEWHGVDQFELDGVRYRTFGEPDGLLDIGTLLQLASLRSSPDEMVLAKTRRNIDRCIDAYGGLHPSNALELGIYEGGSVSFVESLCHPRRLVALDLDPTARPALEELLDRRGLADSVTLCYGVDQADRERIPALVDEHFDGPLDLVIDDASHLLVQTRTSFNMLFPRVRSGGWYVIEDWAWAHTTEPGFLPAERPMTELVFELVVAAATAGDAIAEVRVDRELTLVHRGTRPLDPETFDLAALVDGRARGLLSSHG